nr:glycosyltransferase family 2 protein [Burkholderia sp. Bp9140]
MHDPPATLHEPVAPRDDDRPQRTRNDIGVGMVALNLVIPCFNEEAVLPETVRRLTILLDRLTRDGIIDRASGVTFVDDGSRDRTWSLIEGFHAADPRIHGLKLSRNHGHQNALLAGLMKVNGDVLISLDADLQDDLDAIPRMLGEYQSGAEIVFGVRQRRDSDGFFKRVSARGYYRLLRRFGVDILPDHADFRLMSRRAIEELRGFREVNLFLRGIVPLLGFRTAIVRYDRQPRFAGESKYPLARMILLASDGVASFSTKPLQWSAYVGALLALASTVCGIWALSIRLFTDRSVPGWASTVIPMYFLGGLQLLFLGVIGGYVAKIYAETKQRPRFIVEKTL